MVKGSDGGRKRIQENGQKNIEGGSEKCSYDQSKGDFSERKHKERA